jgi:hypothetical protein
VITKTFVIADLPVWIRVPVDCSPELIEKVGSAANRTEGIKRHAIKIANFFISLSK